MFEKHKSLDILRKMNDLQAWYSENDFWTPDGDRTHNLHAHPMASCIYLDIYYI